MLKKKIKYQDLDGNDLVEDFYFNLTKAELAEMELTTKGGFAESLQAIIDTEDGQLIIDTFKDIIRKSFGVRSEDGKRFMKNPKYFEEFSETDAYSVLFMQLVTDAAASSAFIRGIVPQDLSEKIPQDKPSLEAVEALRQKLAEPPAMAAINPAQVVPIQKIVEEVRNELPEDEIAALREMSQDELIERLKQAGFRR